MQVQALEIPEVKLITPRRFADSRGYFCETYNAKTFAAAGIATEFVQDNESHSAKKGTVRGLHFQAPPFAQTKLVRVLKGAILDVAVDGRKSSNSYGAWITAKLSAESGAQLLVPAGFLHGFVTLEADTIVAYKVDAHYDRASEGAVRWNDPDLGVDWGITEGEAMLSDKDAVAPSWADFKSPF